MYGFIRNPVLPPGVPWLSTMLAGPAAIAPYLGGYLVQNRLSCRVTMLWPNRTSTTAAGTGACGLTGTGVGLATAANINAGWAGLMPDAFTGGWLLAEQVRFS